MPAWSPCARWRILAVLAGLAVLTVAQPALADGVRDRAAGAAPVQPIVHEFMVLQPQLSATLIGLALAQLAALPAPAGPAAAAATPPPEVPMASPTVRPATRPRGLLPLFASYAALQALDVHSTLKAIDGGAVERNPMVAPMVSRPAGLVALKLATAAGTIVVADRLSRHNRVAAYALMFALNSAYAFVVVHNYRVAGR